MCAKSIDIKEPTRLLLARINSTTNWFKNVGQPLELPELTIRVVESWKEAIKRYTNLRFSNKLNGISNDWDARSRQLYGIDWYNNECQQYAEYHERLIAKALSRAMVTLGAVEDRPGQLENRLRGNFACALWESEFPEMIEKSFYVPLLEVYLAGHFPCDLIGRDLQTGTLVVY